MNNGYAAQVAVTAGDNYERTFIKQKVQDLVQAHWGLGDEVKTGNKVAIKINLIGGSGSALSSALHGVPFTEACRPVRKWSER
jgi:hypothetical protein